MIEYKTMSAIELRAIRKGMAMTQAGVASVLGISRKTIVEMEAGRSPIDERTAISLRRLAERTKLIENSFLVDESNRGTWLVVRRTSREMPSDTAMFYMQSDLMLYGEFPRRVDAYRWCAALRHADNPRNTRALERKRAEQMKEL
jgi:DNA-binding XRE family transcriptional regulator